MTSFQAFVTGRILDLLRRLISLDRSTKLFVVLFVDAMLCVSAVWIGFSLRLGEWDLWGAGVQLVIAAALTLWLPIFLWRGIYNSVVRFVGTRTMLRIAVSCFLMMIGLGLVFTINGVPGVPRTIAVLQPLIFAVLLVISRLTARYIMFDVFNQQSFAGRRHRVLIYGGGSAGRQLALSLRHEPNMVLRGYIDDDNRLTGKHLDGVGVFDSANVSHLITRLEIDLVLLAIPRVSRQHRERIVRKFQDIRVRVLTLPAMGDLLNGSVSLSDLRPIQITDLLGREPVPPNDDLLHKTVTGLTVMVTGAGGSIGSELCRQISRLNPAAIVLVEMTEHALYAIEAELNDAQKKFDPALRFPIHTELGSIIDDMAVRRLFERWRPDTVFHAAAYKHVPLVEENVIAGLRNNIYGTFNCATEADRSRVSNFILVSTDKAVRPTNVMGSSKRVCELILQALAARGSVTRFAIVRFGNVLGSSGSVVPRFQRQIQQGGPVTLTHRNVTRYFMTIPEAAQLVIQAGAMAEGGEVYVLDMGDPILIYEMARTLINLSGFTVRDADHPEGDIEIKEIGLRKGEKLYEELLIGNSPQKTSHARIMRARESYIDWESISHALLKMNDALNSGDRGRSLEILSDLVPEFTGEQAKNRPLLS